MSDPPTIERHCEQLDVSINSALNELRSVAYLLLPQDLFEGGLKAAIEQYAAGFAARTSLVVEVSISPEVDTLPYEKQQSLMRIAQEALTNVHRHARATKVDITIQAREGEFNLENSRRRARNGSCGRRASLSCADIWRRPSHHAGTAARDGWAVRDIFFADRGASRDHSARDLSI